MNDVIKIKNPYHNAKDNDYCKCEYSVYTPSIDFHAPMYCTRCGKVIMIYNPVTSEEHARQLEAENAELKAENQKWKDEWQEQVQKATDEGYARTLQTVQLTKAKKIIKTLLRLWNDVMTEETVKALIAEAEQFLNEVEK